jgi:UDP-glucuronate 4-epimerase
MQISKSILVTGAAGFIGMHVVQRLINEGHEVIGLDNINSYYDTSLKYARLKQLGISQKVIYYNKSVKGNHHFSFIELDLNDAGNLMVLFAKCKFDMVINLAAQAGVRHSINNPQDYIASNINGFFNLIEACRSFPIEHFIFASSSSVYGNSKEIPFKTTQQTDAPVSLYAVTKKTNELMAHTYSHLYGIPCTGLRFFTVYGPWGRPDMAYYKFTKAILASEPISLYNHGDLYRDFTYIDDIVESIQRIIQIAPSKNDEGIDYSIMNIGNSNPVLVIDFIKELENILGIESQKELLPMQPGDVYKTYADIEPIIKLTGFSPQTSIREGLKHFVTWYKQYYQIA